jgi:hypothetical protein
MCMPALLLYIIGIYSYLSVCQAPMAGSMARRFVSVRLVQEDDYTCIGVLVMRSAGLLDWQSDRLGLLERLC